MASTARDYELEFKRTRNRQLIAQLLGLAVVGGALLGIHSNIKDQAGLILAVALGYAFFTVVNWRCPKCRLVLPQGFAFFSSKCPRCNTGMNPGGAF